MKQTLALHGLGLFLDELGGNGRFSDKRTKSYFHQLADVDVIMTMPHLFQ